MTYDEEQKTPGVDRRWNSSWNLSYHLCWNLSYHLCYDLSENLSEDLSENLSENWSENLSKNWSENSGENSGEKKYCSDGDNCNNTLQFLLWIFSFSLMTGIYFTSLENYTNDGKINDEWLNDGVVF